MGGKQTNTPSEVCSDLKLERKEEVNRGDFYHVILLNDDYTPMDFVVVVLKKFFGMSEEKANTVMLQVHKQGQAVCAVLAADVAETKVSQVNRYARDHGHPLLCVMEKL